jgi:RimJ/RimL family protein N-acetyltransferase
MPPPIEFHTERLRLRQWRASDREPLAAMSADAEVMRFFPSTQTRQASDRSVDLWQREIAARGWSNWAVELKASGEFIGFIGLTVPWRKLPFTPCVEIGWRLSRAHWRRGYATEGARAALRVGFTQVGLDEIVSFTAVVNLPSRAVMERIGMADAGEDFDHPALAVGSPLRRHCLYRLSCARWQALGAARAERG